MIEISDEQMHRIAELRFIALLEKRIGEFEETELHFNQEERAEMLAYSRGLAAYGITTIRGCLVMCHLYWEFGDAMSRIPAFAEILADTQASEADKVQAHWLLRTQVLAALQGE